MGGWLYRLTRRPLSLKLVLILLTAGLVLASMVAVGLFTVADHRRQLVDRAFQVADTALHQQQRLLAELLQKQKRDALTILNALDEVCAEDWTQEECLERHLDVYAGDRPLKRAALVVNDETVGWGKGYEKLHDYPRLGERQVAYFNMAAAEPAYIIEVVSANDSLMRVEYEVSAIVDMFATHIPGTIDDTWLVDPGGQWIFPAEDMPDLTEDFFADCLAGDSGQSWRRVQDAAALVAYQGVPEIGGGCLTVSLSGERALEGVLPGPTPFLALASLLLFGAMAIAVVITRHVTRPLDALTERAHRLMQGDVDSRIPISGPREVRTFGKAFDVMAAEVQAKSRKLEEKARSLRRAVVARDRFFAYASHELNTPLTVLKLRLQLLRQQQDSAQTDPTRLDRTLQSVEGEVDRLIRLANTLFDVARAQLGKLEIERRPTDLSDLIRSVVERFEGKLHQSHVELVLDAPASVRGSWDPFRLEQVLFNLIGNAVKFGHDKPIHIRVEDAPGAVTIHITDQGPGIAGTEQDRIFDLYGQGNEGRAQGGMGLGLYISSEIVRAHGGRIKVSSAPGEGATFSLILPR